VTASQAGTVDNGLTVTLSSASNQPKYFTSASFTGTSGTLSGGEAGTTTPATIYSYIIAGSNQTSGFDTNGNLLSYNDLITGGWTMTYDNVNRLSTGVASSGVWNSLTLGWMYDSFGNRKTQTPGGNPNAPVPPAQTLTYLPGHNKISNWGSDQAGNITSDGIHQYAYDSEGRVCAVSYFNTGESAFMAYVYDAEGRRVAKGSTNGLNCNMAANDFTLMEQSILGLSGESVSQLDGSGNFLRSNVYANGQLLATYNNNSAYFSFGDWLGSKRVVANPTGTVAEMCMNLPFGDDLICSANDPSEHHFTGQLHDLETGNDYFNARYYGNSSGRFLSPDPSALAYADPTNPQSLNLYSYVLNNPLINIDPAGLDCVYDNGDGTVSTGTGDCNNSTEALANAGHYIDCDGCTSGAAGANLDAATGSLYLTDANGNGISGTTVSDFADPQGTPATNVTVNGSAPYLDTISGFGTVPDIDSQRLQQIATGITLDSQHSFGCIANAYGLGAPGETARYLGQPVANTKRFITPGTSIGTSPLSDLARGLPRVSGSFRAPVGGPGTGRAFQMARTGSLGVAAARYAPFVGLAADAVSVGQLYNCLGH
jgi:RHS repeat-associated protein